MVPLNETILRTREKRFYLGLQRITLCLYTMMGLFTVNRKSALLNLQYKHLLVTLQRNPHGGPPVPAIDIRPEYVKGFLGTKHLYVTIKLLFPLSLIRYFPIELMLTRTATPFPFRRLSTECLSSSARMSSSSPSCSMPTPLRRLA
jgi:hypothetical protein